MIADIAISPDLEEMIQNGSAFECGYFFQSDEPDALIDSTVEFQMEILIEQFRSRGLRYWLIKPHVFRTTEGVGWYGVARKTR